jgi:hypothetical protein
MKNKLFGFLIVFFCIQISSAQIPALDDLAGTWRPAWQDEGTPAICNFHGGIQAGRNMTSVAYMTVPPYSQSLRRNILEMSVNDTLVPFIFSRWYPYQILRKGNIAGLNVETSTRMVFENEGIFWKVIIKNPGIKNISVKADFKINGHIRRFEKEVWSLWPPRPAFQEFRIDIKDKSFLVETDAKSAAVAGYYFIFPPNEITKKDSSATAEYRLNISPGKELELRFIMSFGSEPKTVQGNLKTWSDSFDEIFGEAETKWEERWQIAFKPNNGFFSGHLPILETSDKAIKRVYYGSAISMLELMRTNLPMFKRSFVTVSPKVGPTTLYYWDPISYSNLWTLLDPAIFKDVLRHFLSVDLKKSYALDLLGGGTVGPWYGANDYTVFHSVYTYLNLSGDWAFLDEKNGSTTILNRLEEISSAWKKLTDGKSFLADYGGAENLSETVPSYLHKVPFLNAANVWMMRSMAEIFEKKGMKEKADQFRKDADVIAKELLGLYIDGKGYWMCRYPDGTTKEVPICFDFFTIARCMPNDLTPKMKTEMMEFVSRDLWMGNWMRALALYDESAQKTLSTEKGRDSWLHAEWRGPSLRADHGCTGAFDAWPGLTAESFIWLGQPQKATDYLRLIAPVLDEGPFGQSHNVANELKPVVKSSLDWQDYFAGDGGTYVDVIIRSWFGLDPDRKWGMIRLPNIDRGFEGVLKNVTYSGKEYEINSSGKGIISKEIK